MVFRIRGAGKMMSLLCNVADSANIFQSQGMWQRQPWWYSLHFALCTRKMPFPLGKKHTHTHTHTHTNTHTHSGYLTPSVAFGNTDIIKNLEDTGKFKVELVESQ